MESWWWEAPLKALLLVPSTTSGFEAVAIVNYCGLVRDAPGSTRKWVQAAGAFGIAALLYAAMLHCVAADEMQCILELELGDARARISEPVSSIELVYSGQLLVVRHVLTVSWLLMLALSATLWLRFLFGAVELGLGNGRRFRLARHVLRQAPRVVMLLHSVSCSDASILGRPLAGLGVALCDVVKCVRRTRELGDSPWSRVVKNSRRRSLVDGDRGACRHFEIVDRIGVFGWRVYSAGRHYVSGRAQAVRCLIDGPVRRAR